MPQPFRLSILTLTTILFCCLIITRGRCQDSKGSSPLSSDVIALIGDISDIDKLRSLVPLKLTVDQLDKMIESVTKIQNDYNQRLYDATAAPIKKMSDEIKQVRKLLLAGGSIPKDFDNRVQKIEQDYYDRKSTEDTRALKNLSDSLHTIFNKEQILKAATMARQSGEKLGKSMKGTDDQFFNYFIQGVLMQYSGTIPLLKDLKVSASSSASNNSNSNSDNQRKGATK